MDSGQYTIMLMTSGQVVATKHVTFDKRFFPFVLKKSKEFMLTWDINRSLEDKETHSLVEKSRSPCVFEVPETMPQALDNDVAMEEASAGDVSSNAAGINDSTEPKNFTK